MRKIKLPLSKEILLSLKAGDYVLLSGTVYTARDAAHARLQKMIQNKEPLPISLLGATIYYVGPTPAKKGQIIGSAGPTTSGRMDAYTPLLLENGLQGMIGKGNRNSRVKKAIQKNNAIYFVACGGAGALLSSHIVGCKCLAFEDLLSEAVYQLELEDFPCFVGIDSHGRDIYDAMPCE